MFALARQGYVCVDAEVAYGGIYNPSRGWQCILHPYLYFHNLLAHPTTTTPTNSNNV